MKNVTCYLLSIILIGLYLFLGSCDSKNSEQLVLETCYNQELGEEILCGTYEVAENPKQTRGTRIKIYFVILPALNLHPTPDPIVFFCGGPGIGGTFNIPRWAAMFAKLRQNRDIILWDQRGTHKSNPLPCFRLGDQSSAQTFLGEMYPEDYVNLCRENLEKQADLQFYNTSIAVDDLQSLINELGYGQINIIGGSYGSRSGYVFMSRYPQQVRSALFWAINPPEMKYPSRLAPDTEAAMERLMADCKADPDCQADYPDLEIDFLSILHQLLQGPVSVEITNPLDGNPETVQFAYYDFVTGIRGLLYSHLDAAWIPFYIYWAAQGNFAPIVEYTVGYLHSINTIYMDGLYLCIQCTEHEPFINHIEAAEMARDTFMGTYRLEQQQRACQLWVQGSLPAEFFDTPPLSIPTLVISGELDPVTIPEYGQILADTLTNSFHYVIPNHGHGVDSVWDNCLDDQVLKFIQQPGLQNLNFSCADNHQRPPFKSWRD